MSILDWIEKLRQRPEVERRRILVASTFLITGLIFIIWLSVRFYSLEDNKTITRKKESGPMSEIRSAFSKFGENLKEGMASIKNVLSSTTISTTSTTTLNISSTNITE